MTSARGEDRLGKLTEPEQLDMLQQIARVEDRGPGDYFAEWPTNKIRALARLTTPAADPAHPPVPASDRDAARIMCRWAHVELDHREAETPAQTQARSAASGPLTMKAASVIQAAQEWVREQRP